MGFNNPITGQEGALILQQMKSPNFDQGAGVGWAIMKDGSAYFFDVTASGDITATQFDGTDFVINSKGIFFYSGTPANGNLVISVAGQAGVDSFLNSYPEGLSFNLAGKSVVVGLTGGSPLEYFVSGLGTVTDGAAIQDIVQGAGTGQYEFLQVLSATDSTQKDLMLSSWGASSSDGTQPAQLTDQYKDSLGAFHVLKTVDYSGFHIPAGSIAAVEPGTGGSRGNVAQGETWHTPVLGTGWSTPARFPLQYRLSADGMLEIVGNATTTSATPAAAIFTLPIGWRPTLSFRVSVGAFDGTNALVMHSVNVSSTGVVQFNSPNIAASGVEISFDHRIPM